MELELLNKIKKEYLSGESLNYLSKEYNIPKSTLHYNLSKLNIIRKMNIITQLKSGNELLIGTFIGIWAGDGSKFRDRGRYVTKIHLHKANTTLILFIKEIIYDLFDKRATLCFDGGNRASLRFYNKFIHEFIEKYLFFKDNKCLSVKLKEELNEYSKDFLDGFILGLTLSDGSIRNNIFVYSTISNNLKDNVISLLNSEEFSPKLYIHKREKYGWYDLNQIRLRKKLTTKLIIKLNNTLKKLNYKENLENLKTK